MNGSDLPQGAQFFSRKEFGLDPDLFVNEPVLYWNRQLTDRERLQIVRYLEKREECDFGGDELEAKLQGRRQT